MLDNNAQNDWDTVLLKDTASYFIDGDWIESEHISKEGTRIIQTGNIGIGEYLDKTDNARFINSSSFKKLNCKKVYPGDLLICRLADPIGRCCLVPDINNYYVTSVDVAIYRPNKGISKEMISYLLNSQNKLKEMADFAGGSTRQRISRTNLGNLKLYIPKSFPEQQKIAHILTLVDGTIEKTDQLINKYKSIKQGLMQDLFQYGIDEKGQIRSKKTHKFKDSPFGRIPEEWVVEYGRNIFQLGSGTSLSENSLSSSGDCMYLKVEDLNSENNSRYIFDSILRFNQKEVKGAKIFNIGSIIFAKRGAAILLNRVRTLKGKATLDPNLMALNVFDSMDPQFFSYYLQFIDLSRICDNSGIPQLNNKHLYPRLFIKPSKPEQTSIAKIIKHSEETIDKEQQYKYKLLLVKQGLMNDLLSGTVRVNHLIS